MNKEGWIIKIKYKKVFDKNKKMRRKEIECVLEETKILDIETSKKQKRKAKKQGESVLKNVEDQI